VADDAEAGATHGVGRQAKVNDVEDIEEFRAKLQDAEFAAAAVAKGCVLDERNVELMEAGPTKRVAAQGAEAAGVRAGDSGRLMGRKKKELLFAPRPK